MKARQKTLLSREPALDVLEEVRLGRFAEHALSDHFECTSSLKPEDRGLITELVYGVLRWQMRLDSIIKRCSTHPAAHMKPSIRQVLRIGLYQLFLLDRVPDHAAVDETVKLAHKRFGKATSGFVNAVLRRALRERESVDPRPRTDADSLATYYSHPIWLVRRWCTELGPERTESVLKHNNTPASVVVRANTLRTSLEGLAELWNSHQIGYEPVPGAPNAMRVLGSRRPVRSLPGFAEGLFLVQDPAAQMIAELVHVQPGERVLDACAAPGGKTSHLVALAGGNLSVTAVDSDPDRLRETADNLERLGASACVTMIEGDIADPNFVQTLGAFDRVLLDPPCTNLGVLRHNPEARYRIKADGPARFATLQSRMLNSAASVLKPGGTLVYSVCTVSEEETNGVVQNVLKSNPELSLDPITVDDAPMGEFIRQDGCFSTFPPPEHFPLDGFFAARLRRDGE